ncbi:uncharacterized protein [Palaemon carinicauda]|uniref:uncharacterized protein n=1 Tax=Palaemon carinicauda TaxID=392227 RepID=UPI0035B5E704
MKVSRLLVLMCAVVGSSGLVVDTLSDSSLQTKSSLLITENPLLQPFSSTYNHSSEISGISSVYTATPPVVNAEFATKDCTSWINPTEHSENPSAFSTLPAVISVADMVLNETFSLAIVDKYGEQLACFKASATYPMSKISLFVGKCDETEPIFQDVWPDLTKSQDHDWPCLVEPLLSVSDYFHIDVSAKHGDCNNESLTISFSPNGNLGKAASLTVSASAEFIYIFATRIKTGVNMVYFHNGYTASKCQTLEEPVKWNEVAYFLPNSETAQVKIYISYCHFTEVLSYAEDPHQNYWHKLSFTENPLLDSQEHIFFYRNVLVDDIIIGNITTTTNYPPLLLRLMRVCPLREAKISMTNAIWTNRCEVSDMTVGSWVPNGRPTLKTNETLPCKNLPLNISITFPSILLSSSDPDSSAQDCSFWTNPEEASDTPSAFAKIPSVISVSGISYNGSFRLAIVDKYRNQLACFEATAHEQETYVSIFSGKCSHRKLVATSVWPQMIQPDHDHWPCLVKPHLSLAKYFHIEIRKNDESNGNQQTAVSFRPNGKSEKEISVNVHSSAEFVYIYGTKIITGVNLVYYLNDYIASKCQTLDEPVRLNHPAYFLPLEGEALVRIYISYCHFTEVINYAVNPNEPKWHKLSFREDSKISEMDNIFFHRNVLVDGLSVGNVTTTMEHPPILLHLMKLCPLKVAKISMSNAVWTHRCSPKNIA